MVEWIEPTHGQVWRARLILDGPLQFARADVIANQLKAAGAAHVWVWKSTDSNSFPEDWPDQKREDLAGFLEVQWYVQLQYGGDPLAPTAKFPTSGPNWRIHDAWVYIDSAGLPVEPPVPPGPPVEPVEPGSVDPVDIDPGDADLGDPTPVPADSTPGDVGDYAGRPSTQLDIWAPRVIRAAYVNVMGVYPTPQALQAIQAVGRQEGWYGWATKPAHWAGHHNWGAITCRCPCGFESKDGYYVNGKWQPYTTCFAHRNTNLEGAMHLVEVLVLKRQAIQDVMDSGNLTDFARAMRDTTYFCRTTGKGKDGKPSCSAATDAEKQADAVWYATMLDKGCGKIAAKTGLPQVCFLNGPGTGLSTPPTLPPEVPPAPSARVSASGIMAAGALVGVATTTGIVTARMARKR